MKIIRLLFVSFIGILFSSCALDYYYSYQSDKNITGKAVIIPTMATSYTYVMLNDSLILSKKYVKSLTLENLPDGEYTLQYTSYNPAFKEKLDKSLFLKIENGVSTTSLVAVPPYSSGYWIYGGLIVSTMYAVLYFPLILSADE